MQFEANLTRFLWSLDDFLPVSAVDDPMLPPIEDYSKYERLCYEGRLIIDFSLSPETGGIDIGFDCCSDYIVSESITCLYSLCKMSNLIGVIVSATDARTTCI